MRIFTTLWYLKKQIWLRKGDSISGSHKERKNKNYFVNEFETVTLTAEDSRILVN